MPDENRQTPAKFAVDDRVVQATGGKPPSGPVRVVLEASWNSKVGWVYKTQEEGKPDYPILPFPEKLLAKPEPPPLGHAVVSRPY